MLGWIRWFSCLALFAASQQAFALQPWQGQFLYRYEGGNVYRVFADNTTTLRWQCIEGDEAGAQGEEHPDRLQVRPDVFFVSWTEKTGIHVTQVLDFKSMRVYSTITDGSARHVLRGKLIREK